MAKIVRTPTMAKGGITKAEKAAMDAHAQLWIARAQNGVYVVAHSETGHHHVIERKRAEVYEAADDAFVAYVRTLGAGAEIVHKRDFHTHETIALPPNRSFEVRRQREYVPEGFRKAQD